MSENRKQELQELQEVLRDHHATVGEILVFQPVLEMLKPGRRKTRTEYTVDTV
jgi:hypothetical protein